MKYLLLLSSMLLSILGQLFLKSGITQSSLSPHLNSLLRTIFSPLVFIGFICYGLSAVVWLFVLQKFPLSVAYPALAVSYILIVFISFVFFKEPITLTKIVGIFLIFGGVFFIFR